MKTTVVVVFSALLLAWCWGGGAKTPPSVAAEAQESVEAPVEVDVYPDDLPEYVAACKAVDAIPHPAPVQYTAEEWAIMRSSNPRLNLPEEPGYHNPSQYLTDEQKMLIAEREYWHERSEINRLTLMYPGQERRGF